MLRDRGAEGDATQAGMGTGGGVWVGDRVTEGFICQPCDTGGL